MTGTVVKAYGRYYTVNVAGKEVSCVLRGKLKQDDSLKRYTEPVVVGDTVEVDLSDGETGAIESVLQRKNVFSRKDKHRSREDIIAANLDQIVVIQSFKEPRLNLRFVDRLVVRGRKEGIPILLCVNKYDLADRKMARYVSSYYRGCGLDIVIMSAKAGKGLRDFRERIAGRLSIFIGYSGVGKSTILNRLYPGLNLRTGDISQSTGKGKHTTTNVEMLIQEDNTRIIDTPGLREFGLYDIAPEDLASYFCEFASYSDSCNFRPCTHEHEPGCLVKRMVEDGDIMEERYISYLNILHSLKENHSNRFR